MRLRRPFVFSLLLACSFALGHSTVDAAPKAQRVTPKPKGVGPKVFTKLGLPAIRISEVANADAMVPTPAPPDTNPWAWKAPFVEPFEGVLQVTATAPVAGPVGANQTGGWLQTIGRPLNTEPGFYFTGVGEMGISLPRSAAGSSALLVSCEGYLPKTLGVFASHTTPAGTWKAQVMELHNLKSTAKFVIMPDGVSEEKNAIFTVGIAGDKDAGWWRVDRCTIERV